MAVEDMELVELLGAVAEAVQAQLAQAAAAVDLSPPLARALRTLDADRPLSQRELGAALRCDPSNVTDLVDRLEIRGYLERRPDRLDRRVKRLVLTEEGRELKAVLDERSKASLPLVDRLSTAERRSLARLLEQMLDDDDTPT